MKNQRVILLVNNLLANNREKDYREQTEIKLFCLIMINAN